MASLTDSNDNPSLCQRPRFLFLLHGRRPQGNLKRPYNVQEIDGMDSSNGYSQNRYSDSRNGKARAKLRTNRYNWRYSPAKASMVQYAFVMLFTIANAIVIPVDPDGNTNPQIDSNGPSNPEKIPQPWGNQISGGWSAMDVMAVISVTMLSLLVYLSTQNSRGPHINLGISLLAAFWIHWTVFRGDATLFLFSIVWTYNMGNTLALLVLEVSTLKSGVTYAVVVALAGTIVDGILTSTILPVHDVSFMAALPHSIAASMILAGIFYRLQRLVGNALTQDARNNLEGWFFYAIRPRRPGRLPE